VHDAVGIGVVSQKLVADFSGSLSDAGSLVENRFLRLVALDFINDQHMRHANSKGKGFVQVTEMLDVISVLHKWRGIHHMEDV